MQKYRVHMPTELICGPGEFARLGTIIAKFGKKALVLTGRSSARKYGFTDRALELLQQAGVEPVLFEKIEPNPRHSTCDEAARLVVSEGVEVIVAIGGGSPMDASKAISAAAVSGRSCWDHCFHDKGYAKVKGAIPIITVPTTAATGSEADGAAVITNWETHEKCALIHDLLKPVVAICDPELHVHVPPHITADGAIDILSHGFESYFNGDDDCTVQDRITEGLFNTVFEWAPVAYRDGKNIRARRELQYASTLVLTGIANNGRGGTWVMHPIEHALSGHYDIAHGRGLAIIMPRYLRFAMDRIQHRLAQFGRRCFNLPAGDERKTAEAALDHFVSWLDGIGQNITLGDVGIGEEKFDVMAEDVIRINGSDGVIDSIIPLDKAAVIEILQMCRKPN